MVVTFKHLIAKYGVDRVKVEGTFKPLRSVAGVLSYTSSDDPDIISLADLDFSKWEGFDHGFNHKVTLRPHLEILASQDFYICDLESIIENPKSSFTVYIKSDGVPSKYYCCITMDEGGEIEGWMNMPRFENGKWFNPSGLSDDIDEKLTWMRPGDIWVPWDYPVLDQNIASCVLETFNGTLWKKLVIE